MKTYLICCVLFIYIISSCNTKKPEPVTEQNIPKAKVILEKKGNESIEGVYETKTDNTDGQCKITLLLNQNTKRLFLYSKN
ncbi:hypothetical protein [Flavobacterium foetidum]|uniref:hypothetical protein n=1 Tax=Flavobacterium foetidum TaxID=2026681 RepID=UPI001FCA00D3|nr:hypothetical protein [Flavobacterium foetidum]